MQPTTVSATVHARLAELVAATGSPAAIDAAVVAFLAALDDLLARIEGDDASDRAEAAHRLAGSAETLGALELGARCRQVMAEPGVVGLAAAVRPVAAEARAVLAAAQPVAATIR